MASPRPTDFRPALTDARLRVVAEALLDVFFDTELEMATPLDDGYTRGCATFGRQRNALIHLCTNGEHEWLKLTNAAMDVTFEIGGVPCRFFADDPLQPRKRGFFRRNACDQLFADSLGEPALFRFIVAKPATPDEDVEVFFIGYDEGDNEVFRWQHSRSAPVNSSDDADVPAEVALEPAKVRPRIQAVPDKAAGDETTQD